jgi:4-amino-4-deoxy-L-arabinose transferase-like glycosyltransferase
MLNLSKMTKLISRVKNIEYLILSFILILGFVVRLYAINNPIADWHSFRQADTASVSRTFVEKGVDLLNPRYHDISTIQSGLFNPNGYRYVEFPIYNFFHALLVNIFPAISLEVVGRLVSIFSTLTSGVLLFLIARKVSSKWHGLVAAFFYTLIPYNIYFTRVILPEPLAVSFALASLLLFIKFNSSDKKLFLYLSGIFLALALLVKPFLIFYTIPMIYLTFKKYGLFGLFKKLGRLAPFLLFGLISAIPLLLWRFWIGRHPEGIPFYQWLLNGDGIRFKPSFWKWIFTERLGNLILGTWGVIPFSLGFFAKNKNYFNLFFLLGMFLYVSTVATANVRHDYYQIITIPAIALALADGSVFLWTSKHFNKVLSRLILTFSVVVMFIGSAVMVKEFYKINHPEIILAGQTVDRLVSKDALVIAPYNGDTAFLYQTGRWGWPYVDRPIEELIERGADYYVSVNYDVQTNEFIQKFESIEKNDKFIILDLHMPYTQ